MSSRVHDVETTGSCHVTEWVEHNGLQKSLLPHTMHQICILHAKSTHVFTLFLSPLLAAGQHRSPQWDLPAQRSPHHRLQGSGVPTHLLQIHFSADPVGLHTSRQTAIPLATGCPVCKFAHSVSFILRQHPQRKRQHCGLLLCRKRTWAFDVALGYEASMHDVSLDHTNRHSTRILFISH